MPKMKRKPAIKWGIIALVVLILIALAYNTFKPKEEIPNYLTATVEMGDIENNVMASGKVKALNTVDVGAQVSGEVTRLYVEVGDQVQQGDLIAQIDQVTQNNNLSNEQATLEQSVAAIERAEAEVLSRQAGLKSRRQTWKPRMLLLRMLEQLSIRQEQPLPLPQPTSTANEPRYENLRPMLVRLKKILAIRRFARQYQVLSSQ